MFDTIVNSYKKSNAKLILPINLTIFDNLKEKAYYFSDLAFEEVKKEAQRRIDQYNRSSWWNKFWDKKTVKENVYIGILGKTYRHQRLFSSDCIEAANELIRADIEGVYYLSLAELALKTNGTVSFCRANGIGSIEMTDSDVEELNKIEKEYSKK